MEGKIKAIRLAKAVSILRCGGLVAFPTETVYGLGARAFDAKAVRQIFKVKQRPMDNPLILHIGDLSWLPMVSSSVSPLAVRLAKAFWPGPLTLVLPKSRLVPREATAGLQTVAVRIPSHAMAIELLKKLGEPIAAPSANRSGRPSPTTARHVCQDFGKSIDFILDGGPCRQGIESTIVDMTQKIPRILRPGAISQEAIKKVIGRVNLLNSFDKNSILSPGLRHRHYAPRCRVVLFNLGYGEAPLETLNQKVGILCRSKLFRPRWAVYFKRVSGDVRAYARELFSALREAEKAKVEVLYVEAVPAQGVGQAVMDRLLRASGSLSHKTDKMRFRYSGEVA